MDCASTSTEGENLQAAGFLVHLIQQLLHFITFPVIFSHNPGGDISLLIYDVAYGDSKYTPVITGSFIFIGQHRNIETGSLLEDFNIMQRFSNGNSHNLKSISFELLVKTG